MCANRAGSQIDMPLPSFLSDIFADPFYWKIVFGGSAVALTSLLLFSIPYTVIAVLDPPSLRKYKIQTAEQSARDQSTAGQKVIPALANMIVNYALSIVVTTLAWPVLKKIGPTDDPAAAPTALVLIGSIVFCMVVEDAYFYVLHRTLHHPWLYGRLHKWHHQHRTPIALTGAYMHPLEQQLILGGLMLPIIVLRAHSITFFVWLFVRNWDTAEAHSGYDFPWNPTRLIPGYDPSFHDYHHSYFNGNYASLFSFWDRIAGTIAPGYEQYLSQHRFKNDKSTASSAASTTATTTTTTTSAADKSD